VLTPNRVHDPVVAPQQYAVVMVNEDQLSQLIHRPAVRQVNSRFGPQDVYARYQKLKRRTAVAAILLLLVGAGGFLWFMAPQPAMASMFPWSASPALPALSTGASFSVTIASLDSGDAANIAATRVRGFGLPAFTRRSPGKAQMYQAMVGPYASLEEAERAQRRLGNIGYPGARLFVDESLRGASRAEVPLDDVQGNPVVALLGAPDRLSLVLELPSEVRQVNSRRTTETMLDIDAGPMERPVHDQQWSAPEGVHLIRTVALEGLSAPGGAPYLRARVALPEFARANVRTEGRRVYVDLTWPLAEEDVRTPRRAWAASSDGDQGSGIRAQSAQGNPQERAYLEAMGPVRERVAAIRPFLLSAAQSGSPDVMSALDQTLATFEASISGMSVPAAEAGQHQLLLSATQSARRGLEPGFTGDRLAHAQKAIAMFDGAMAPPATSTVP
jgi:hypothetical protein